MIEFSSGGVPMIETSSNGVSTWARTSATVHPSVFLKYRLAFCTSIRRTNSRRMCSCSKPKV